MGTLSLSLQCVNNHPTFPAIGNPTLQVHDYTGVRECLTLVWVLEWDHRPSTPHTGWFSLGHKEVDKSLHSLLLDHSCSMQWKHVSEPKPNNMHTVQLVNIMLTCLQTNTVLSHVNILIQCFQNTSEHRIHMALKNTDGNSHKNKNIQLQSELKRTVCHSHNYYPLYQNIEY